MHDLDRLENQKSIVCAGFTQSMHNTKILAARPESIRFGCRADRTHRDRYAKCLYLRGRIFRSCRL